MMHSDTPETGNTGNVETSFSQRTKCSAITERKLTADRVFLSKVGRIKEMISCFLKGGQHEDTLLHLGQTKPGDSQYLPL